MIILFNVGLALCLALLNIAAIRFVRIHFPKSYFSLGQIVVTEKEDISLSGILVKFLPPFITGVLLGIVNIKNVIEICVLFGFFASFLVVWPVILAGDELLSCDAMKRIKTLYLIYFLYISQYIILAVFGLSIGKGLVGFSLFSTIGKFLNKYDQLSPLWQNVLGGAIGSALFVAISGAILKVYRFLFKGLFHRISDERMARESEGK